MSRLFGAAGHRTGQDARARETQGADGLKLLPGGQIQASGIAFRRQEEPPVPARQSATQPRGEAGDEALRKPIRGGRSQAQGAPAAQDAQTIAQGHRGVLRSH